jgi:hypothetical protein
MQVFEQINKLKGTNATKDQIAKWSYMNRYCPIEFEEGLELDCDYPKELYEIAQEYCKTNECGHECLDLFLSHELPVEEIHGSKQ